MQSCVEIHSTGVNHIVIEASVFPCVPVGRKCLCLSLGLGESVALRGVHVKISTNVSSFLPSPKVLVGEIPENRCFQRQLAAFSRETLLHAFPSDMIHSLIRGLILFSSIKINFKHSLQPKRARWYAG